MNHLLNRAEKEGPVMSKDNSIHGASGGGLAPVGTVSWGLMVSEEWQGLHDAQYSLTDELPLGQK